MSIFNAFSDMTTIEFYLLISILSLIGAIIVSFLIIALVSILHRSRKLKLKDLNIRYYTFNSIDRTFTFFDKNKLNPNFIKTISFDDFKRQLFSSSKTEVENWLERNLKGLNDPTHAPIDDHIKVFLRLRKEKFACCEFILNTAEYSPNKKNANSHLLHFESHILPDVKIKIIKKKDKVIGTYKDITTLSRKGRKISEKYLLDSDAECQRMINEIDGNKIGAIYYISIYYDGEVNETKNALLSQIVGREYDTRNDNIFNKLVSDPYANRTVLSAISSYLDKDVKLYNLNPKDTDVDKYNFIIVDNDCLTKAIAFRKADDLATSIQMLFNNFEGKPASGTGIVVENSEEEKPTNFRVSIGFTINSLYNKKFAVAKEQCRQMAAELEEMNKEDNEAVTYKRVMLYDPNFATNDKMKEQNLNDVKMLVDNSTFRVYFQPTYNLETDKKSFYMVKVVPFGTNLKTLPEVLWVAKDKDIDNGPRRLLSSIINRVSLVLKKQGEQNGVMLNIAYSNDDNDYLTSTFDLFKSSGINWIFCLDEVDLFHHSTGHLKDISDFLFSIKKEGFKLALLINSPSPLLWDMMKYFDFFIVGKKFTTHFDNSTIFTSLSIIEENYGSFSKPLIYIDLPTTSDADIAATYGAKIVQCNELALPSSIAEELDQNMVEKIRTIADILKYKFDVVE